MIAIFKHLAAARPGWMTVLFLHFFLHSVGLQASSGTNGFSNQHPDSVVRMNPNMSFMAHEPGEVLVKFQDAVKVNVTKSHGVLRTGIPGVDELLATHGGTEVDQLIRGAQPLAEKQMLTAPNGTQFERPSLHNIYLLKTGKSDGSLSELIEALKEHPSVVYAEPNYIYRLVGHTVDSPVLTADDLKAYQDSQAKQSKSTITPNDPFFDQQWWIEAVNAHLAWKQSTGDTTQVIAIIDTGVDWQHPDLQNKIWTNPNEIANGQDSDGNGFVDDIRGWDFINNNNNPMDDNSHGTHVAGIAAAEADNGIGIAGVSWGARIMPVKVLQSSGAGTVANVVQGVNYASVNGATVINMSLGSYAYSMALEDALANAYANAVLVAAAGNDGLCIGPDACDDLRDPYPMFPAALSFVLGVEATKTHWCEDFGWRAPFSNFDQDGPIYSAYPDLWNYELQAPGLALWSTIPGGSYRSYSGTSMAAPIVAGAVSIYNSIFPNHSQELMWANLIHKSSDHMDIHAALEGLDGSRLGIVSHMLVDTLYGGDGDGSPHAGETIQLWYTLRNTGIQADDVHAGIRMGEFEDPDVVEIIDSLSFMGSISPYATRTNEQNPFKISIADNVVHNRDIVFEAYVYNQGETDTIFQSLVLTVEHGTELSGVMDSTLTLYPNQLYLVNQSFRVGAGATLIIKPGTEIAVYPNQSIEVRGRVIANGTSDSLIVIRSNTYGGRGFIFNYGSGEPPSEFSYCHFYNLNDPIGLGNQSYAPYNKSVEHSIFESCSRPNGMGAFNHNVIKNGLGDRLMIYTEGPVKYNTFYNSGTGAFSHHSPWAFGNTIFKYNNFVNLDLGFAQILTDWANHSNNFIANGPLTLTTWGESDIVYISNNYWGSTDEEAAKSQVNDFWDNNILPMANFHPMLEQPSPEAHGVVWKVLVNGADAQDEFVEPVGVGPQRFDVYFNRPMDIEYTPNVSFGVRYPYNQQAVTDSMSWSADSTVFTAWKTIQLYTGDGINRVRITGARDPESFEIPPEYFRFEFLIDAAGAASTNFLATPGMGRVDLGWDDPDELDDFLGYNMYRFEHVTDTTFTEPILINQQLILEPEHTDFDILPGDKYYYYYKILRTNMAETDSSRVVSTIPHTAAPGDANGDYSVDVMDIVAIVAYMLGNNPQPFIFEAADVNQDQVINVLDIVGVVQLINSAKQHTAHRDAAVSSSTANPEPAYIHLAGECIRLESMGQVAALQFELHTAYPNLVRLSSLLPGFELAWTVTDKGILGILFNMQGNTIPQGMTDIIRIEHQNPDLSWGDLVGADPVAGAVDILTTTVDVPNELAFPMEFVVNVYPNPAKNQVNISYFLPMGCDVQIRVFDVMGRQLENLQIEGQIPGQHTNNLQINDWTPAGNMVFCQVTARSVSGEFLQKTVRLMLMK